MTFLGSELEAAADLQPQARVEAIVAADPEVSAAAREEREMLHDLVGEGTGRPTAFPKVKPFCEALIRAGLEGAAKLIDGSGSAA